jgi:hypothetical protein
MWIAHGPARRTYIVRADRPLPPPSASGTVRTMSKPRAITAAIVVAAVLAFAAVQVLVRRPRAVVEAPREELATEAYAAAMHAKRTEDAAPQRVPIGGHADTGAPPADDVRFTARIGRGPDDFGAELAREGVQRGPAALEVSAEGAAILDLVNGVLRRIDPQGRPLGARPLPSKHVVEAIALPQGKTLFFERSEAGQGLVVTDAAGQVVGRLAIPETVANADADVSRVVVRGETVYVETNGTGPLHAVGTTAGEPLPEGTSVDGYPTRDDRLLLSAGITNEDEGRAWLNASDRATGTHRWTREIQFADEATAVGFLDDDGRGHGWLVVLVGGKPGSFVDAAVCFDTASGNVIASHAIAVDDPPWQSFRDFSVGPAGELFALRRSRDAMRVLRFPCEVTR